MQATGDTFIKQYEQMTFRAGSLVNGKSVSGSGQEIIKESPRDGRILFRFHGATQAETRAAAESARQSFNDGRWSRCPVAHRKKVLHKLAELLDRHQHELALLECVDVGKPIRGALEFDVPTAAETIRYSAEAADKLDSKVYGCDLSSLSYQLRRPVGVVAGIVGWNFPLVLAAEKVGPALATGNSVVLKPSEFTSLSAFKLAELALEAGLPEGVLNLVSGAGETGAALSSDPNVDLISFTGSSQTGKKLMIVAGQSNMKRLILECGGKAPNIVFEDCPDLDSVAKAVVARAFWNQGQVCTASSRLIVHRAVKNGLLTKILEHIKALTPTDPLSPDSTFGALVSRTHLTKVRSYVEAGMKERAKVLYECRAEPPFDSGFYVAPVIFDEVTSQHRIAQEEIFGPILSVLEFEDESEAIQIANSTIYGLSAIVWTQDLGRAHRVAQYINSGWIVINATSQPKGGPGVGVLPIGGHKESGLEVAHGLEGLEAYTSRTSVQMFM